MTDWQKILDNAERLVKKHKDSDESLKRIANALEILVLSEAERTVENGHGLDNDTGFYCYACDDPKPHVHVSKSPSETTKKYYADAPTKAFPTLVGDMIDKKQYGKSTHDAPTTGRDGMVKDG